MLKLGNRLQTDVLVVGAGLGGVMAAIHAAKAGTDCTVVSASQIFSGASFFPGTWGFGLIAPDGADDVADLKETIERIGMGMATPTLAGVLAGGIGERVRELEGYGLRPLRPTQGQKGEQAYIPCFDHKHRDWYGLVQADAKAALQAQLEQLGVRRLAQTEILALRKDAQGICGALAATPDGFVEIVCKAVILACGGLGGLHRYAFGAADCCGLGQLLALEVGASLVNLEFSQMMLGFVRPAPRTIYNEKVYTYSHFYDSGSGEELFADLSERARTELFACRAGHGPFTSRLPSKEVDLRVFAHTQRQRDNVILRYDPAVLAQPPEFVKTYFDWLRDEKGLTPQDEVRIGVYYHASNGGVRIDANAATEVPGLYACGEGTGGMHGADRLGGLSTANALVFGSLAGRNAALHAKDRARFAQFGWQPELPLWEGADEQRKMLAQESFPSLMLAREERTLEETRARTASLATHAADGICDFSPTQVGQAIRSRRFWAGVRLTEAIATAALMRKESRGAHCRLDYEQTDPAFARQILLRLDGRGDLDAAWHTPK